MLSVIMLLCPFLWMQRHVHDPTCTLRVHIVAVGLHSGGNHVIRACRKEITLKCSLVVIYHIDCVRIHMIRTM